MKYGNQKVEIGDRVFASKKEGKRFLELKLLERGGKIYHLECQKEFLLVPNRYYGKELVRALKYIADFYYFDVERNEWIAEDTKGYQPAEYKIKKKIFLDKYVRNGDLTFFENGEKQIYYKKIEKN